MRRLFGERSDTDRLIAEAEQVVIERDARVRRRLDETKTRVYHKGLVTLVFLGGALLFARLFRTRRPGSPGVGKLVPTRRRSILARAMTLLLPLLPGTAVAGRWPALLIGLLLPMLEQRRVSAASIPKQDRPTVDLPSVASAEHIDLERYAGSWYEIASLPAGKDRHATGAVTTYAPVNVSQWSITRRIHCADGGVIVERGIARVPEGQSSAQWKLSFLPFYLRWWPGAWKDYWILAVDDDYRYAVAGTLDRKMLWILSRTPTLTVDVETCLIAHAKGQHFPTESLRRTTPS